MSAIFPTSGPWQIKGDFDVEDATTIIGNVDGEIIDGTTHHTFDFVCRTLDDDDDSQSRSIAVANARFIVKACNAHAVMLDALKSVIPANLCLTNRNVPDSTVIPVDVTMGELRRIAAAIAKGESA